MSFADQSDQARNSRRLLSKAVAMAFFAAISQFFPASIPNAPVRFKSKPVSSWSQPGVLQAQKFSWTTGEDQAPVIETKRFENIHGVRVRTALHTLAPLTPEKINT